MTACGLVPVAANLALSEFWNLMPRQAGETKCVKQILIKALELILAGERHVPARLLGGASGLRETRAPYDLEGKAKRNNPLADLNLREREVLAFLAEGLSNADIGKALGMSANGANHHLKSIYRKLGVSKRTQAMAIYFVGHSRSA